MSIGYSINFVGSANLAHRARRVACVAGVKIMNTSLLFAEPLPAIKHLPDECLVEFTLAARVVYKDAGGAHKRR